MSDPTESRNTRPRTGTPLWTYLSCVTIVGLTALAVALMRLTPDDYVELARTPPLWVLAGLIIFGELRPVKTPGSHTLGAATTSTMFAFAALLYFGLPVAVLLQSVALAVAGVALRTAWHRILFNVAQLTLSFTAAAVVLGAFGYRPTLGNPFVPTGSELLVIVLVAAAYFVVTLLLVAAAVALHERRPLARVLRESAPYAALVHGALLGIAPLIVVVMQHSTALLALFVAPLAAVYAGAAMTMHREYQALHDTLTGLPNRKLLVPRTEQALMEAAKSDRRVGLLLLDLDRFKEVNDTLGHLVGDRLLQTVAHRLGHSVRPGDVVARLGGDEFAILLPNVRDVVAAREVAARLRAALGETVRLDGMSFDLEASIGIALYPDHAADFELLLQRADVAMYLAKENRSGVEGYRPEKDRNSTARLSLIGDLRRALNRGELHLFYQPKVTLGHERVVGTEALIRWLHPDRGVVAPDEFIPLAEQSYLMRDLTQHVVDTALAQIARWWHSGLRVPVSINVSARDLVDCRLATTLADGLMRYDIPASAVQLEVTERVLMTDQAYTADSVEALAEIGIQLALDDFGTGYSSLVRLKRLPVREVKIDSSFVRRLTRSGDDAAIVRSIVDLVRSLGLRSVAEGVESDEVATMLLRMGCDVGQGYWYSRPLPADKATTWLTQRFVDVRAPALRGHEATA